MAGRESLVSAAIVASVGFASVLLAPPVSELIRSDSLVTATTEASPVDPGTSQGSPGSEVFSSLQPRESQGLDRHENRRSGPSGLGSEKAGADLPVGDEGLWVLLPATNATVLLCRPGGDDQLVLSEASVSTVRQLRPVLVVASTESKY